MKRLAIAGWNAIQFNDNGCSHLLYQVHSARMPTKQPYNIEIKATTAYIPEQSLPEARRFVFAYTITITNRGEIAAKLLSRHWIITDADERIQEVKGMGVIGEQPHLQPGESFTYTSAAMLETPLGCMQGSYQMLADDGVKFDAPIQPFNLAMPHTLH